MTIQWMRLVAQGRCKNVGIPWSEEEAHAVHALSVPAEYVRRGCLTVEAWQEMKAKDSSGEKTLEMMTDEELMKLCVDKGLSVTPDAPRSVLLEELNKPEEVVEEPAEKPKKKVVKKKAKKK